MGHYAKPSPQQTPAQAGPSKNFSERISARNKAPRRPQNVMPVRRTRNEPMSYSHKTLMLKDITRNPTQHSNQNLPNSSQHRKNSVLEEASTLPWLNYPWINAFTFSITNCCSSTVNEGYIGKLKQWL